MAIEHSKEDQQQQYPGIDRKMEIVHHNATPAPHLQQYPQQYSQQIANQLAHHSPLAQQPHHQLAQQPHHHQFVPQYYYPSELEGQYPPHYPDYEFLGQQPQPVVDEMPAVVPGAGMAAASTSSGYESPPPELDENPPDHPGHAGQFYHRAPPPLPQGSAPYPIVTQQSGPIRTSARRPSATASHVLVDTDPDGTVWIKFEYTRNRVKWLYRVRCDVERVNEQECLTQDFKQDNCIYPKAMVPPEEYTGHRQKYETECNHLGWRLAWLNPDLRNRRGLIQRAVDSYRNSSGDISVRSRRVRRLAKQQVTPRR